MKQSRSQYIDRSSVELADVLRIHKEDYLSKHKISVKQHAVINAIINCRSERLGYHIDRCDNCGHTESRFNSCRDRHCPKCQGISRKKWVDDRLRDLLPVPYYHVVFSLPHFLNELIAYNKKLIFNLLLSSSAETLLTFGQDPKWLGGKIGFYGVLHTWGQTLWPHVHVHYIVAGGGLSQDGKWRKPCHKGRFLFPVMALSKVFRGKFIQGLKQAQRSLVLEGHIEPLRRPKNFENWISALAARNWVVYCKAPFGSAEQVVRYIGRYTHRVAISNRRILSSERGQVLFRYKDYKASAITWRQMALSGGEFIRRFLWHVLPSGFHKIRHYGFLANGRSRTKLAGIKSMLSVGNCASGAAKIAQRPLCPKCKTGRLKLHLLIDHLGRVVSVTGRHAGLSRALDTS